MNDASNDTIAALATAPGSGAIAIVRLSGSRAIEIAEEITGSRAAPRVAHFCEFREPGGGRIDEGLMLVFPGPHSYTGEDVVELHGHGGPIVSDWLLQTACTLGARAAEPGEFTLRAFLNDKLDLTQAEAVADLIASSSRTAARAALRSLSGRFSAAVDALQDAITAVRVHLEAHLDFPDEEIPPATHEALGRQIEGAETIVAALVRSARQGVALRDGLSIVIAGPPNAGKSSLLNRLTGYEAAIVTDIPGTTRDTLRETLVLEGLPVHIVDTAGLRDTADPIETEGLRRARNALERADRVLWITEIHETLDAALAAASNELGDGTVFTLVRNKVDLTDGRAAIGEHEGITVLSMSALSGAGIDLLIDHLKNVAGFSDAAEGTFSARRRHLDALSRVCRHLEESRALLGAAPELAAEELRAAQHALSQLTGEESSDELLGRIFSTFCIGK